MAAENDLDIIKGIILPIIGSDERMLATIDFFQDLVGIRKVFIGLDGHDGISEIGIKNIGEKISEALKNKGYSCSGEFDLKLRCSLIPVYENKEETENIQKKDSVAEPIWDHGERNDIKWAE